MIATRGLTKRYGEKPVLEDVTLELPKNRIIAFVGSNGAGKSTLISLISRTLSRSGGEVFIDGRELAKWNTRELSKTLSILRQSNSLTVRLTVRELVSFGRFPYSQGRLTEADEALVDNAISYLGLGELQDRYLDQLSGGQRQMAFIAMVVAQDTEYIFLDEPLNNLDMHHSVQIMKVLRQLVEERGKTVMVVIHDINFVSCYADYVVAMKGGRILSQGHVREMMSSDSLCSIYDMEIQVREVDGMNVCLYYR